MDDRGMVAVIAAGSTASIVAAYDKYAATIYGYCHWMLREPGEAAEALRDTFVIATATPGHLPEAAGLSPRLYTIARRECLRRRRIRPVPGDGEAEAAHQPEQAHQPGEADQPDAARGAAADATMPMHAIGYADVLTHQPIDATMPLRAIGYADVLTHQPIDATMPLRAIRNAEVPARPAGDATMIVRAVGRPAGAATGRARPDRRPGPAELRTMTRAILADLTFREREVIELHLRHDLHDADLAQVLGVPPGRARVLTARAVGRLEQALGELLIARTSRSACPELDALVADWDGRPTEPVRDLISGHVEQCRDCTSRRPGGLRRTALSGLMPLVPPPAGLREQVLELCSSPAPAAVALRRRVTRRAEAMWLARFSQVIGLVRWSNIRAYPGPATAAVAVVMWVVAAVGVSTLIFADAHPARAVTAPRPSVSSSSSRPVVSTAAPSVPARAASPSPSFSHSRAVIRPPAESSPASGRPSRSRRPTRSPSPKPSGSPSPKPSASPSPSPSPTASPSASPSPSPSG